MECYARIDFYSQIHAGMLPFKKTKQENNHKVSEHIDDSNIFCSDINILTWFNPRLVDQGATSLCDSSSILGTHFRNCDSQRALPWANAPGFLSPFTDLC